LERTIEASLKTADSILKWSWTEGTLFRSDDGGWLQDVPLVKIMMADRQKRDSEAIAYELEAECEAMFGGEIEVDESYFGNMRKGKRSWRGGESRGYPGFSSLVGKVTLRLFPIPPALL
jgi:hypothetical protein